MQGLTANQSSDAQLPYSLVDNHFESMCGFLKVTLLQLFYDMDTLLRFVDK